MNFNELLEKYQQLLIENNRLKEEIKGLKAQYGLIEPQDVSIVEIDTREYKTRECKSEINTAADAEVNISTPAINNLSDPKQKIKLFMSLFKGREDVYAKRWENTKKGTSGYSPVCANEWRPGVCQKGRTKCTGCAYRSYLSVNEQLIDDHLRGRNNLIVGIYPMCTDETCYFLAIDFDDGEWQNDITALREVCTEYDIPVSIERSRSGKGAHAWFFFETALPAVTARKFGSALLSNTMSKRHEITFKSYDRFFPNQDTMPKGGMGNLIALPLQKVARSCDNSIFIDENFLPFEDQWAFLSSVRKLTEDDVDILTSKLCHGNELGILRTDDEDPQKPWEITRVQLTKGDFPKKIEIIEANMLFVPKSDMTQRALNHIKRLAAFRNPEFYKAQAMRLSTKNMPRVISCSDETLEYLCLPRGCRNELYELLRGLGCTVSLINKTNSGRHIDVEFNGTLRDEQPQAVEKMLEYNNGVLCGTTAFGKTVAAIKLIAERKVNTLILVDKISLVEQWRKRLSEFLIINEVLPDIDGTKKRGRKKERCIIGQLGAGKDQLGGIIDIAVIQSINRMGEVKECVKNYGMVIVDECHHVSAFSFEEVLKCVNSKYVYGLTATPTRKDGHHPIIFMQCGTIRYRDDAKKQAEKRPFEHYVIPRFTSFRGPLDKLENDVTIQDYYSEIVVDEVRNQLILDDIVRSHKAGRNCVVLTERTAHVEILTNALMKMIPDVISVTGSMGMKEARETMAKISSTPIDRPLTLVATGKYIGEGFDEPRLDTLFLAMPISWKGTLQQYAGRLHRLFDGKNEVQIFDYVDIHVRMLERMYNKRLSGYASIGYKAKGDSSAKESLDIIFDKSNFLPVYNSDIIHAKREVLIVSPFVTKKRSTQMLKNLKVTLDNNVKVVVLTRPIDDFAGKDVTSLQETLDLLKNAGIDLVYKSNFHQKFAIIDKYIIWYGSINLMSFGSAEESILRLESPAIANELIRDIELR